MKLAKLLPSIRTRGMALLTAGAMLVTNAFGGNFFNSTVDGVNLGNANGGGSHLWAVFALSGGVSITDPGGFLNPWDVLGSVGVAGSGNLTMSASRIQGDFYKRTGASTTTSGGATITGTTYSSFIPTDVLLSQASADATNASKAASAAANNWIGVAPTTIAANNVAVNLAIAAVANTTYVLHLTDLILSGAGAVLTLSGNNQANVNYIVNINRYMSLSSGSKVVLTGGLQPYNVLFNVQESTYSTFTYDATLSGGSKIADAPYGGSGTLGGGVILAPNRTVKLTGASEVKGEVIGKAVSLSGNSRVYTPMVSP